jgi:hypothetical protein
MHAFLQVTGRLTAAATAYRLVGASKSSHDSQSAIYCLHLVLIDTVIVSKNCILQIHSKGLCLLDEPALAVVYRQKTTFG